MATSTPSGHAPLMVDAVTADLLAHNLGSRSRALALLAVASMDILAQERIGLITGAPVEFVRADGISQAVVTVEITPQIGWRRDVFLARPGTIPETVVTALIGRPVSALIEHPGIPRDMVMTVPGDGSPDEAVVALDGVRLIEVTAGVPALLAAWCSIHGAEFRVDRKAGKPLWRTIAKHVIDIVGSTGGDDHSLRTAIAAHIEAEKDRRGY